MYNGEISTSRSCGALKQENSKGHPTAWPSERPKTLHVLVVDDDFAIKVLVTAMLEVLDCLVDRAENGAEALERMATKRYDLVVTDLYMPGMDGFSLSRAIRSQWPDTKIVIMTGADRDEVQSMAAADGVDAWLYKPFGLGDIRRLMDRFESP
jgi:CheY-like chemotaxis protein